MKSSNNTEKALQPEFGNLKSLSEQELKNVIKVYTELFLDCSELAKAAKQKISILKVRIRSQKSSALEVFKTHEEEKYNKWQLLADKTQSRMRAAYMALTEKQLSHAK